MPWSSSRPGGRGYSAPIYQTREHRHTRALLQAELRTAGSGQCAEILCKMPSRLILPGMDLHLCHNRQTGAVLGLGHAKCNRSEAARYARALQSPTQGPPKPYTRTDW